jgi:hypothetical protein
MQCEDLRHVADRVRDIVEAELLRAASADTLIAAANSWWEEEEVRGGAVLRAPVIRSAEQRWPILTSWRWLVPMPSREAVFNADVDGHSSNGTAIEGANDLAYRGVLPRALGIALAGYEPALANLDEEVDVEDEATFQDRALFRAEASRRD